MELEEIIAERKATGKYDFADFLTDPNIYCLIIFAVMLCFMFFGCHTPKQGEPTKISNHQDQGQMLKTKREPY